MKINGRDMIYFLWERRLWNSWDSSKNETVLIGEELVILGACFCSPKSSSSESSSRQKICLHRDNCNDRVKTSFSMLMSWLDEFKGSFNLFASCFFSDKVPEKRELVLERNEEGTSVVWAVPFSSSVELEKTLWMAWSLTLDPIEFPTRSRIDWTDSIQKKLEGEKEKKEKRKKYYLCQWNLEM